MQTLTHIHTHTHTHTPTNFMKSSDYFSLLTLSFWFYVIKPSDELYCFTTEESWMVIRFFTLHFIRKQGSHGLSYLMRKQVVKAFLLLSDIRVQTNGNTSIPEWWDAARLSLQQPLSVLSSQSECSQHHSAQLIYLFKILVVVTLKMT